MKDLVVFVGIALSAGSSFPASTLPGGWTSHRTKDGTAIERRAAEANGMLLVRCAAGRPKILLKWRNYRGSHPILVTAQLDRSKPVTGWWPRAVGRREVEFPGDQASYLRGLRASRTLVIRLSAEPVRMADAGSDGTSDGSSHRLPGGVDLPLQMTFSLSGLAAELAAAQGSCGPM